MNAAYTEAIQEAYALAPANKVILDTLELRQTGVQDPVYLVRARQSLTAFDEDSVERTFLPCGFQFALPPENEDGFRSLTVAIDNVKRLVRPFIAAALSSRIPVQAIYRPYLSDDLTQPQMVPPLFLYLKDLTSNDAQVTGRATFMDLVNRRFPLELYTRLRFPTLG